MQFVKFGLGNIQDNASSKKSSNGKVVFHNHPLYFSLTKSIDIPSGGTWDIFRAL